MRVFWELGWFFKERKWHYTFGVAVLLIVAFLSVLPPRIVGFVVDEISGGTLTAEYLVWALVAIAAAAIAMYGLRYVWRMMIFGSSIVLARQMRDRLFTHFTQMAPSFYQKRRVGDLMAHATNDLQAVQQTAGIGVLTLVDSLATGGFVIAAMALTVNWKLTLIVLLPMPLMIVLTNYYGTLLHRRFHKAQAAFSDLNDKTQESISGMKVLKTFGQEKEDVEAFVRLSDNVVRENVRVARVDALFDPTISLIIGVCYVLTLGFGTSFVLSGDMSLGDLIAFITYLGLLIWPMLAFGWLFNIVERGRASYDRIRLLLAAPVEIEDRKDALDVRPSGDIEFAIDRFSFPGDERAALRNVHFILKQGQTLGIVGKTGSGKSVVLRLLLREFDQYDGEIRFGGKPLDAYRKQQLRQAVGYVPQDHFLFSMTVAGNIAFGRPDAPFEKIREAASLAHIDADIRRFSDGYDTVVGERGVSLSGGQKQRISIARALMMEPELLILDDSLSAVDARTEEAILRSLKETRIDGTTIITAHRLSAVQHAHQIMVMHEGEIAEIGSHDELMAAKGRYYEMYELQQLEALVEEGGGA